MSNLLKSKKKKVIKKNFQSRCALSKECSNQLKFGQYSYITMYQRISPSVFKIQNLMKNIHFRPALINMSSSFRVKLSLKKNWYGYWMVGWRQLELLVFALFEHRSTQNASPQTKIKCNIDIKTHKTAHVPKCTPSNK